MSAVLWSGAVLLLVLIFLPRAGRGDWQSVIPVIILSVAPERGRRQFPLHSLRVTAATWVGTSVLLFAPGAR
jgi:hypothetical protein